MSNAPSGGSLGTTPILQDAWEYAEAAHSAEPRKRDGTSYVRHTAAVAELVAGGQLGEPAITAAILHDSVENTSASLKEIERRFGPEVARLVDAMTEDDGIDSYAERKRAHRSKVEAAGRDALAIYAADRVANLRAVRVLYGHEGEDVESRMKASLDCRVELWREDLDMLVREVPDLPYLADLEVELRALRADRVRSQSP